MRPLRVAILADYLEEEWPSMDLVADMLLEHLEREHGDRIAATLVRPRMPRPLARAGLRHSRAALVDRIAARQLHYPRVARALPPAFDVYHVVDHTYGHLAQALPAGRTIVTCHDIDAFRSISDPPTEQRSAPFRWMSRRILAGLRRAARVPCDSEATRSALLDLGGFAPEHLPVIPNGTDTSAGTEDDYAANAEAARLLGPRRGPELLHVGSTIPRKRIDVLLDVFAAVRRDRPGARLIRVGGPFTADQRVRARELGVLESIAVLPFVDRATLAAVYRRAALALLPSDREGFGLPLVEAMASGTPVVASDIDVLREIGGTAASYCPVADIPAWRQAILDLLTERDQDSGRWDARRRAVRVRARIFTWSAYAAALADLYQGVAGLPVASRAVAIDA